MQGQRWLYILIGIAAALALGATAIATFYTDVLWFKEVGYISVFTKVLTARFVVAFMGGLFFFVLTFINLQAVLWGRRNLNVVGGVIMPVPLTLSRPTTGYVALASLIVGILGGLAAYTQWHVVLAHFNATPFNIQDPVFGKDVGFYIFNLPFITLIQQHLWVASFASLIVSGVAYFIFGDLWFSPRRLAIDQRARIHLSILTAILFLLKAWDHQIDIWNLMYSSGGVAFGASYTDIHAQAPAYRLLIIASILGALVSLFGLVVRNFKWVGFSVAGLLVLSVVVGYAYPAFMQQFTVSPNELAYELPFIKNSIEFTRKAFDLDHITPLAFPATENLTAQDIVNNPDTINNLRLWDYRVTQDTYSQVQEIRDYYVFNDVDVDRYVVNDSYTHVVLSARELDITHLPPDANTWINLHLKYTHGYGLAMSPSSRIGSGGMPQFYFMDIPPRTNTDLALNRPEIYFGELTNHYIIVNTNEPEFDYPSPGGETLEPTFYEGTAGVPIGSFLKRLAFTLRFRHYQILVSGALNSESRLIMRRNILDRVTTIAPFLMYDRDPYLVLADGKLYWLLDAYTISANYPYSQPDNVSRVNYIRNSVKVVIDAYNGSITFYQSDMEDPIINTYAKIFPGFLTPISEMPDSILEHIRYPQDIFEIQARMLTTYHVTDPNIYYNKEDYWEIPTEVYANVQQTVEPYYVVLTLPEETEPEYLLMTPFAPRGKPNMVAWLGVRCNPKQYGQSILFSLPKDRLIPGPMQIESLFGQDPNITEVTTLWGQSGSQVIRGNLLVIPVEQSFLYVEPLYLQAANVRIPELKRVLMYYGGKVVMGTSIDDALAQLFGTETTPSIGDEIDNLPQTMAGLLSQANALYQRAKERIRVGDWAGYGEAIEELGNIIGEMQRLSGNNSATEEVTPPVTTP
jgi:uncharacterized membrane protein (UPF0182 family)